MVIESKSAKLFTIQNAGLQSGGVRAMGTTYQNKTGRPMFVAVTVNVQYSVGAGSVQAKSDKTNPPATIITKALSNVGGVLTGNTNIEHELSFMVLPSNFYLVEQVHANTTLRYWTEWF